MGRKKLKIIKEDCDLADAQDKSLPNNAFLVEYRVDDASHYDLVFAGKQSEIFDHYYDTYKKNFVTMNQAEGRSNPKLWGIESKEKKKK